MSLKFKYFLQLDMFRISSLRSLIGTFKLVSFHLRIIDFHLHLWTLVEGKLKSESSDSIRAFKIINELFRIFRSRIWRFRSWTKVGFKNWWCELAFSLAVTIHSFITFESHQSIQVSDQTRLVKFTLSSILTCSELEISSIEAGFQNRYLIGNFRNIPICWDRILRTVQSLILEPVRLWNLSFSNWKFEILQF